MNIQKSGVNLLLVMESAVLILALVIALLSGAKGAIRDNTGDIEDTQIAGGSETEDSSDVSSEEGTSSEDIGTEPDAGRWYVPEGYVDVRVTFSAAVEQKLSQMTTEQKVAQLFVVTPEALTGYDKVTAFGNASKQALNKYQVGGLVYNTLNFQNKDQVIGLTGKAKDYALQQFGIPLLTAIEEEGGANGSPLATTIALDRISSASELGNQGLAAVEQATKVRAEYVKQYGFNTLLATIGDVSPALDTAYRLRTYGTDANLVASMITADVKATKAAGIWSALKYFPGKASATANGAGVLASSATMAELSQGSLITYQSGIDAGADMVMIGNVIVESITGDANIPCSLSNKAVGLLRESMGFTGVIITESFADNAFVAAYGAEKACVEALQAGVDMIYMPADFVAAYNAVLEAVNNGTISADRLNNAVGRVLTAKGM